MQEIFGLGNKYHPSKKGIKNFKKILNTAKKIKNYHTSFVYLNFNETYLFYDLCGQLKNFKRLSLVVRVNVVLNTTVVVDSD